MKTTPFHRADPTSPLTPARARVNYRFGFDRSRHARLRMLPNRGVRTTAFDRCSATRQAIVPGSIHGACDPSAAHYVHSAPATVLRRSDLVSLRSTSQPGRHSVAVRGIWWILWAGRDIGRIFNAAVPRHTRAAVPRRIIAAVPRLIIAAVPRRVIPVVPRRIIGVVPRRSVPRYHGRAAMPEMAKGCRTDAREWNDRSRRRNRSPDCPPSALIGQNGRIE